MSHLTWTSELILGLRLANERRCYKVPLSLIGWAAGTNLESALTLNETGHLNRKSKWYNGSIFYVKSTIYPIISI